MESLPPKGRVRLAGGLAMRDKLAFQECRNRFHELDENLVGQDVDIEPVLREGVVVDDGDRDLEAFK